MGSQMGSQNHQISTPGGVSKLGRSPGEGPWGSQGGSGGDLGTFFNGLLVDFGVYFRLSFRWEPLHKGTDLHSLACNVLGQRGAEHVFEALKSPACQLQRLKQD